MTELPRISRRTDPASSAAAEVHVNTSGVRQSQMEKVMAALDKYANCTAFELSQFIHGMDRYQVQRRLSDLERIGKVKKGMLRSCLVTGRQACTWEKIS